MKSKYSISKNKCCCCLTDFYENAAKKAKLDVTDQTMYDCRKIRITESVKKCLHKHYYDMGLTKEKINALFAQYGPKANLYGTAFEFEIDEGFVKSVNKEA